MAICNTVESHLTDTQGFIWGGGGGGGGGEGGEEFFPKKKNNVTGHQPNVSTSFINNYPTKTSQELGVLHLHPFIHRTSTPNFCR